MKLLGTLVLTLAGGLCWDEKDASALVSKIGQYHGIGCLSIRYPPQLSLHTVFRFAKALTSDSTTLKTFKVSSMAIPSELSEWSGCPQVLTMLLAWVPSASAAFKKFSDSALVDDPLWVVLLPEDVDPLHFFGNSIIPFQARVLAAVPSIAGSVRLTEVWQAAPDYPLRFAAYALWKDSKLLCPRPVCTFRSRKDLEGAPLKASTKDDMPIAALSKRVDGVQIIEGYFGAVFQEIVEQINGTVVVVICNDSTTGSQHNGTWNGLIGMMVRKETDLAVGPMTLTADVKHVASYLPPLLRTNYQIFFKQAGTVVEWDAFLKPFGQYIWRIILIWFIVAAMAYNYCYKIGCQLGLEDIRYAQEFSKLNSFLTFFRAFCTQGSNMMPQSTACRGLHLTGYITSAIVLTAYSASLITKLTLQAPLRPFDSLETFLSDGTYSLIAIGSSTDYTYFSEATDPLRRNIYEKMMSRSGLPVGKEDGMMQVCHHHKRALFITFAVSQLTAKMLFIEHQCPILWFSAPLGTVYLSIGIRKNMPYTRLINHQYLLMVERGVSRRLMKQEWPLESNEPTQLEPPQLELKQVAQIHLIFIAGTLAAVLILTAEIFYKNSRYKMRCDEDNAVTILLCLVIAIILTTILFSSLK